MKSIRNLFFIVLSITLVFGLASCDLLMSLLDFEPDEGVTIPQRIQAFENALNEEDREYIASAHFHSDMQLYTSLAQEETLTTGPLRYANAPFTFSEASIVTAGTVERATVTFENFFGGTGTIVFTMEVEGDDYMIRRLEMTVDNDPTETEYELFFYNPNLRN